VPVFPEHNENADDDKTINVGEKKPAKNVISKPNAVPVSNKTSFEEEYEEEMESGNVIVKKEQRSNRRLVGWLVTYSIDTLGIDYRLYEGRNVVGRDADSQITVNDKTVSGKHATILFRADKYKIKDELSSHGTFVNGEDIEEETVELHDGDIIKLGDTIFKFKTSF
jgi:pSer/pThr/pTyr-binding forkhead associated (FHA) protein